VEVGKPFKLTMISEDVLHSLFIPAFRVKQDVVPGRYATTWFTPTRPGEYTLFCAEYCGKSHSDMLAKVIVYPEGQRAEELAKIIVVEEEKTPPLERGLKLYNRRGCAQCHTIDGSAKVGPSFKGIFGTQQKLADGSSITVDDNYIRESILEPNAKVRAGYRPQMPSFKGQLKDRQIEDLILFIKSLNENPK
jgi:cytochrome c oxidase subunit II